LLAAQAIMPHWATGVQGSIKLTTLGLQTVTLTTDPLVFLASLDQLTVTTQGLLVSEVLLF